MEEIINNAKHFSLICKDKKEAEYAYNKLKKTIKDLKIIDLMNCLNTGTKYGKYIEFWGEDKKKIKTKTNKMELPKETKKIDVEYIKKELLHSESLDDIKEINKFCVNLINIISSSAGEKMYSKQQIIDKINEL